MEAPGIEPEFGQPPSTIEPQSGTIGTDAGPANVPDRAPKCSIVRGDVTESSEAYDLSGVVETALAKALVLAAEAKRWDVVMQIAEELRSRRNPGDSDGSDDIRPLHWRGARFTRTGDR